VGRKDIDDGVLLIVAPNERKARIEVGYGLEKALRDEEAGRILRDAILPAFRAGDYAQGHRRRCRRHHSRDRAKEPAHVAP
jgi:uncharacterized protein